MALLAALGGVGDEADGGGLVASAKPTPALVRAGLLDGAGGCGVGKGDTAVGVDLAKMPGTTGAIGEVVLEAAVGEPAGIIDVVQHL